LPVKYTGGGFVSAVVADGAIVAQPEKPPNPQRGSERRADDRKTVSDLKRSVFFIIVLFLKFVVFYFCSVRDCFMQVPTNTNYIYLKQSLAAVLSSLPHSRFQQLFVGFTKTENVNFNLSPSEVLRNLTGSINQNPRCIVQPR
jgi:hypothetical protein